MEAIVTIDRALGCQMCEGPLGESTSDDFCGEPCQTRWHASQAETLPPGPDADVLLDAEMSGSPIVKCRSAYFEVSGAPDLVALAPDGVEVTYQPQSATVCLDASGDEVTHAVVSGPRRGKRGGLLATGGVSVKYGVDDGWPEWLQDVL